MAAVLFVMASPAGAATARAGKKAKPLVYADYSVNEALGNVWSDESKGCKGTFEKKGGKAVLSVPPCADGWGAGVTLGRKVEGNIDATGKVALVIRAQATKGAKFIPSINEAGVGPKDAASYEGVNGTDGEQWWGPELVGTGQPKTYTVKFADFKVSEGYGNQNGNKKLDAQALVTVQIAVGGNQSEVKVEISSIKFE
jgi:hypothetical protein